MQEAMSKITKLEVLLSGVGLTQLVAVIWFFAKLTANVDNLTASVSSLSIQVAAVQSSAPQTAVLNYRVDQLEKEVLRLKEQRIR